MLSYVFSIVLFFLSTRKSIIHSMVGGFVFSLHFCYYCSSYEIQSQWRIRQVFGCSPNMFIKPTIRAYFIYCSTHSSLCSTLRVSFYTLFLFSRWHANFMCEWFDTIAINCIPFRMNRIAARIQYKHVLNGVENISKWSYLLEQLNSPKDCAKEIESVTYLFTNEIHKSYKKTLFCHFWS